MVILGGGFGGASAALLLRKRLPRSYRIIVIDQAAHRHVGAALLRVMTGERTALDIVRPLRSLERKNVDFLRVTVRHIDPLRKQIHLGDLRVVGADAIIIALGASYDTAVIPGLEQAGHSLYTLEGFLQIHESIATLQSGRIPIVTADPTYKCPATHYEAAMLLESLLRKRGVRRVVEIDNFAAEAAPMPTAGKAASDALAKILDRKGISFHSSHKIPNVDTDAHSMPFENGVLAQFDLLLYVSSHRAPDAIRKCGLAGSSGWINVDHGTLQTKFEDVYAIGDVACIPLSIGFPLPKATVFAVAQAKVVDSNLIRKWTGRGRAQTFNGRGKILFRDWRWEGWDGRQRLLCRASAARSLPSPESLLAPGQAAVGATLAATAVWWKGRGGKRGLSVVAKSASNSGSEASLFGCRFESSVSPGLDPVEGSAGGPASTETASCGNKGGTKLGAAARAVVLRMNRGSFLQKIRCRPGVHQRLEAKSCSERGRRPSLFPLAGAHRYS